ncbi:MAG: hypothetical protein WCK48_03930, partial [bacterium]
MGSDLFFENKKYILVKNASALTGYSKDYIGQLSRSGKIDSRRIGRAWYVCEESLLKYKNSPTDYDFTKNFAGKNEEMQTPVSQEVFVATNEIIPVSIIPKETVSDTKKENKEIVKKFNLPFPVKKVHEKVFDSQFSLTKKLLPFAIGLFMTIGLFSLKDGLLAFADTISQVSNTVSALNNTVKFSTQFALTQISDSISKTPNSIYSNFDDVSSFYSEKLSSFYTNFGSSIKKISFAFVDESLGLIKNPPLYIVTHLKFFAMQEKNIVDRGMIFTGQSIYSAHNKLFTFISDSFDGVPYVTSGLVQNTTNLTAQVSNAIKPKINNFDKAGIFVYEEINSLFYNGVYSPLASLFNKKPNIVNTVYVVEKDTTPIVAKVPTKISVPANSQTSNSQTKIIEVQKTIERVVTSDVTKDYLEQRLQEINNSILSKLSALSTGSGGNITNVYNQIAGTQRIDNLSGTQISNPNITGGSISGASISASTLQTNSLIAETASTTNAFITNLFATNTSLGTTSITNLAVTNTGTSTFAGGIDLASGCVSVNGVCLGGGSGSGSGTVLSGLQGQIPFFSANGTTLTATSSLFIAQNGNVITKNILPDMTGATTSVSLRSIGDANNRFSDLWANEVHIGASSLYVNGKKVISDVSNVMNFTTDLDQSMVVKTIGTGNLSMQTEMGTLFLNAGNQVSVNGIGGIALNVPVTTPSQNINLTNNSLNGNITLTTLGSNSQILANAQQQIALTAPTISLYGNVNLGSNTITSGIWNGSTIGVLYGGTGSTTVGSAGSVAYSNGSSYNFNSPGSSGQLLISNGSSAPSWIATSSLGIVGGIQSINGLSTLSQTFATSSDNGGFGFTSSGSTHTLNIPTASVSSLGLLSSTDWTNFNNKSSFAFPFTVNTNFNSTSTTLGFTNGFFSTASSTISAPLYLPTLSQGLAYVGSNGILTSTASSSLFGFTPISNSLAKGNFLVGDDNGTAQATTSIFISSTGNIGIGTSTPPSRLTIGTDTPLGTNPYLLIGTSTLSGASANGTYMGINAPSGFTGEVLKYQKSGTTQLVIENHGGISTGAFFSNGGGYTTQISDTYSATFGYNGTNSFPRVATEKVRNVISTPGTYNPTTNEAWLGLTGYDWTTSGNFSQQWVYVNPFYNPSAATNLSNITMFQAGGYFSPTVSNSTITGRWIGTKINPTFGTGGQIYNSTAYTTTMTALAVEPIINVSPTSIVGYAGLIVNPLEINTSSSATNYLALFQNSSSTKMVITTSGLVGIGTTTPFTLLQLSSTTASATFKPQLAL